VAVGSAGNLYVADGGNNTIRQVTPAAVVTTLAGEAGNWGSADGTGNAARFNNPQGVAVDSAGNVYVADSGNNTIRKVTPSGVVTTLAGLAQVDTWGNPVSGSTDGTGSAARFNFPYSVALDTSGSVYVADQGNNTIRKVTSGGVVTTLAGLAQLDANGSPVFGSADGTGSAARFYNPVGVAVDSAGDLYIADNDNNTIRKGYWGYPPPVLLTSGSGFGFNAGHFGFNLTGPAGQPVIVEASTDLENWLPIWTNTSTLSFSDPQSGAFSRRFYRARTP
jgi:secreted PhoX family phosphatase